MPCKSWCWQHWFLLIASNFLLHRLSRADQQVCTCALNQVENIGFFSPSVDIVSPIVENEQLCSQVSCIWSIKAPDSNYLAMKFTHVSGELHTDQLQVYQGWSTVPSALVYDCGTQDVDCDGMVLESHSSVLTIRLEAPRAVHFRAVIFTTTYDFWKFTATITLILVLVSLTCLCCLYASCFTDWLCCCGCRCCDALVCDCCLSHDDEERQPLIVHVQR